MPRLVLIDANQAARRRMGEGLTSAGFEVLEASSGVEGLLQVLDSAPDLIILAEEMPPLQAADVLVILVRVSSAPIIVLGNGGEPGEIAALESGADSYVRRGAAFRLLTARINALLRRYPGRESSVASLSPSPIPISLTPTERRLVTCLSNHNGRPVGLGELRLEVWGGAVATHTVKYYLRSLRHKLQREPYDLELRCTRGVGYRLVPTESRRSTRAAGCVPVVPYEQRGEQAGVA